jgi:hypothetical protein
MEKKKILHNTMEKLQALPEDKLSEVNDFIDFLISKIEDRNLTYAIQKQASEGEAFKFLEDEEELYSENDLKDHF